MNYEPTDSEISELINIMLLPAEYQEDDGVDIEAGFDYFKDESHLVAELPKDEVTISQDAQTVAKKDETTNAIWAALGFPIQ
jgi:hypothetical protein